MALLLTFSFLSAHASLVYRPAETETEHIKNVLVVIHGCLQSAESMALGTNFNRLADQKKFLIIYPQVPAKTHPLDCWSWFLPENQGRESGQLKSLITQIETEIQTQKIRPEKIFLTGISSGAATAAGLIACYPEKFKAAALVAGPAYASAQNLQDAESILKIGPPQAEILRKRPCETKQFQGDLLVIQGSLDLVVNPLHAQQNISDFAGNTLIPIRQRLLRENSSYTTESVYLDNKERKVVLHLVQGLGHAWPGYGHTPLASLIGPRGQFETKIPFFTDFGPSATEHIIKFFERQ